MAYTGDQITRSFKFASAIGAYRPVFMPLASSRDETVVPADSNTQDVIGLTRATVGTYGEAAAVVVGGVAKAIAAASLGAGVRVAIASTNGALGPLTPSGLSTALGSALGAAGARFVVGRSLHAAAAGAVFSVLLDPGQII
jgi:hypothetical protein